MGLSLNVEVVEIVAVKHVQSGIFSFPSKGKKPLSSGKMCQPSKGSMAACFSVISRLGSRVCAVSPEAVTSCAVGVVLPFSVRFCFAFLSSEGHTC